MPYAVDASKALRMRYVLLWYSLQSAKVVDGMPLPIKADTYVTRIHWKNTCGVLDGNTSVIPSNNNKRVVASSRQIYRLECCSIRTRRWRNINVVRQLKSPMKQFAFPAHMRPRRAIILFPYAETAAIKLFHPSFLHQLTVILLALYDSCICQYLICLFCLCK